MTAPVKVSDLKAHLSRYLRRVRAGETVMVCDRDTIIARIEPAGAVGPPAADSAWIDDLERRGVARRGTGKVPRDFLRGRAKLKANVVDALLREREEGR